MMGTWPEIIDLIGITKSKFIIRSWFLIFELYVYKGSRKLGLIFKNSLDLRRISYAIAYCLLYISR